MWPRGSPQWSVQVFEETFQRVALENRLRGPLMDLENHLMKSTTVSTNRGLNETLIILTRGFRTDEHSTCRHRRHSAELIWQSGSYFGAYISCRFWHSGIGFGDCVCLCNHTLPCKFFQCYSERTIPTTLFWILYLASMGEFAGCTFVRWARYRQFSPGRLLLVWTSLRE